MFFTKGKKMKKILFTIIIVLIAIVSCDMNARYSEYRGKVISEYPDWCANYTASGVKADCESDGASFGYSAWYDWQSDEGKKLHKLVDDSIVHEDFSGKYRIVSLGQRLTICFNDANSSHADFFQYIGDYTNFYKDRIVNIDVESDKVEYGCWLRKGNGFDVAFCDKCLDSNKSKVSMAKIDDKSYRFVLSVADEEVINVILNNKSNECKKAVLAKSYSWFPSFAFKEVIGTDYWSDGYYGKRYIRFDFDSKSKTVEVWGWGDGSLYCFEGVSLRAVDEENKKISFNLLDADKSGFADYLEIHITNDDWIDCPERGATKDNRSLMKGTLGFYKEDESKPIRFYDEEHSEYSRLIY